MPATVELSVPPLRKQAGLLPSSCWATALRKTARNSAFNAGNDTSPAGSVNSGTQYGATVSRPASNSTQWPGGTLKTPLKIVRGDGMAWKYR